VTVLGKSRPKEKRAEAREAVLEKQKGWGNKTEKKKSAGAQSKRGLQAT